MNGSGSRRGVGVAMLLVAAALGALTGHLATQRFAAVGPKDAPKVETVGIAVNGVAVAPAPPPLAEAPVRNVILLLGDGLGLGQLAAGRVHTRGPAGRLHFERFPVIGLVATHPDGLLVTKSDSSATALATGRKTANGRIGVDVAGRPLESIVGRLSAAGWATGLVTTARVTDASPASFATHVAERRMQSAIAEQLVASPIDLLIGGGLRFFQPRRSAGSAREDDRDLLAEARARGIRIAERPAELAAASGLPLFALFEVEPQNAPGHDPAIGALAARAIELLSTSGRPFFLFVEDEEIDSAAHQNDVARLGGALERFDEAVARAVAFAAADGSTLVLVTGDHSTGGPAISQRSTSEDLVVAWESDDHTGEPVPIYAYGPPSAAARFGGMLDNTDVPARIAAALGVEFPGAGARP